MAVIVFHSHVLPLPGGFAGVDVFFVLSGYLITGILLRELGTGTFTFAGFYARRIRRIFPALFVVLAVTTVAAWHVLAPAQLESYAESLLAVVLFVSNFVFAANSGYFSPALEEAPLLHTRSLAVEEQFYLLFPVLLLGAVRWLASLVLAALTWRWVEQPFRRSDHRWLGHRAQLFGVALAGSVLIAAVAGRVPCQQRRTL